MTNKIFYLPIFLLLSFLSCKTETKLEHQGYSDRSKFTAIDSVGKRYLELNRFSGVILVSKGDSITYNNSFGLADYKNNRTFSEKTAFRIGELSELITSAMVKRMVGEGRFNLSDKISDFIPEIQANYTINDLLNHNTKLPKIEAIKEQNPEVEYTTVGYTNLAFSSPGTSGSSELDYNLLGLLIERISGLSYEENLESYGAELGLENTYFQKPDPSLARGYLYHNYRGNGPELEESPVSDSNMAFSSAGVKSTANDLLKIVKATPGQPIEIDGYMENDGFSYSVLNDPQTGTTIIVLSNRRHPVAGEISGSISAILTGKEYRLPLPRKPFVIKPELLKEYSGFYTLNPDMDIEIVDRNDSLFVMMGPNEVHLVPQSPDQFYMIQSDASLRFLRDSTSTVNAVELLDGFLQGNKIMRSR